MVVGAQRIAVGDEDALAVELGDDRVLQQPAAGLRAEVPPEEKIPVAMEDETSHSAWRHRDRHRRSRSRTGHRGCRGPRYPRRVSRGNRGTARWPAVPRYPDARPRQTAVSLLATRTGCAT